MANVAAPSSITRAIVGARAARARAPTGLRHGGRLVLAGLVVAVAGEDEVQRALRLGEHAARLLDLALVAGAQDLGGRDRDVLDQHAGLAGVVADVAGERLPRRA